MPVIARFSGSPPYCPTFGHGVPLDSVSDRRSIPAEALPGEARVAFPDVHGDDPGTHDIGA